MFGVLHRLDLCLMSHPNDRALPQEQYTHIQTSPCLQFSLSSHLALLQQSIINGVFKPFSASFDDLIQSLFKVCHESAKFFKDNLPNFFSDIVLPKFLIVQGLF